MVDQLTAKVPSTNKAHYDMSKLKDHDPVLRRLKSLESFFFFSAFEIKVSSATDFSLHPQFFFGQHFEALFFQPMLHIKYFTRGTGDWTRS